MNLITISNLTKYFDTTLILDQINFTLNSNEKIAIVGRNGAGKSTLAKIICGLEDYDKGDKFIANNVKIGYFSQHSLIDSQYTVYEELKTVFKKQIELKQSIDHYADLLSQNYDDELLHKYTILLQNFEEIEGYTYEYKIESLLNRFGFKDYYNHLIGNLSGGQRTRLALVKLLLEEPDVLILDEPTNHLDIETVEFLEGFLKMYKKSIIIISHDRYFLNQVVNLVYEIEFNKGVLYKGNYDHFLILKEDRFDQMAKQFELQQKVIEKEQDFINKNIVRASSTKQAQSRRKKLEKMIILENPNMDDKNIKVNFDFARNTGNIVLQVIDLSIGYNKPIVKHIDMLILKNEKVAVLGPNGIGKSTLLKTINQNITALSGDIRYGAGVNIAYFDQELAVLNTNKTVINEIWDEHPTMLEKDVRKLLGSFLFTKDDVYKNVTELSGGEKVRLALAKLVLKKANFLILDEVTNHLDILSREVLEEALIDYEGTILFVSHDRFFINNVATKIIEIKDDKATEYIGDYSYYVEKRDLFNKQETENKEEKVNNDFLEQKKQKRENKKAQK
ncbi:MAG: transporter ATP-binding protein, partial [Haloplasmataceae bacterium]|nr:transporter ATP-binding protein [Haloplasmataceae bacterium]